MQGIYFDETLGLLSSFIAGKKTMMRLFNNLSQVNVQPDIWEYQGINKLEEYAFYNHDTCDLVYITPQYKIGETVFVKESYCPTIDENGKEELWYKVDDGCRIEDLDSIDADGEDCVPTWTNPITCKEKQARYFIKIKSIKVERIQDITRSDAAAEGCCFDKNKPQWIQTHRFPEENFETLVDIINGKYTWNNNPWCFVYEFEKTINNK